VLLAALLQLPACHRGDAAAPEASLADVAAAEIRLQPSFGVEHEYSGTVGATEHDELGFELGGTLLHVAVDEGDRVERGQPLAELDTALLETERSQLEAQVQEAEARVRLIAANLKREQSLKRSGFAAEQRLDELRAEQEALSATLARLRANLEGNAVRIAKSRLLAPYAGIVTRRYRDTGATVGAGTPVLRLMGLGTLEVRVGVPARLAERLQPGAAVELRLGDTLAQSQVIARGADIDPVTRTLTVRVALPGQGDGVHEGELVALRVSEQREVQGAWVPVGALGEGLRGRWVVYALIAQSDGSFLVEPRDVTVVFAGQERLYVRGAIDDGERVVAGGLHRVAPGQRVRLAAGDPA